MTTLTTLTDEELLQKVYMDKDNTPPIAVELAVRLEHALDQLKNNPKLSDFGGFDGDDTGGPSKSGS